MHDKPKRLTLPEIQREVWRLPEIKPGHRPSIEDIAKSLGLTYRHFSRRIEPTGRTARQIRSWCCITYAAHLIGRSIKIEAAMTLAGFRNHTHFNEHFRECLGCLPHQFRGQKMRLLKAS